MCLKGDVVEETKPVFTGEVPEALKEGWGMALMLVKKDCEFYVPDSFDVSQAGSHDCCFVLLCVHVGLN